MRLLPSLGQARLQACRGHPGAHPRFNADRAGREGSLAAASRSRSGGRSVAGPSARRAGHLHRQRRARGAGEAALCGRCVMQPQNPSEKPLIVAVPGPLIIKQLPAALSNYSRVVRTPLNLVLHATDGHEGVTQDTDGATEISKPLPKGHEKSFHYIVDGDSVTQCVEDQYVAWHASRRGNAVGIGIEMCGRATQTREQWLDPISLATIQIT